MNTHEELLKEAYGNTDDVSFTCPYCKVKEDIESYRWGYEGSIKDDESVQEFLTRGGNKFACNLSKCFICVNCYSALNHRYSSSLFDDEDIFKFDAFLVFRADFEPLPNQDTEKLREAFEIINKRRLPSIPKEDEK